MSLIRHEELDLVEDELSLSLYQGVYSTKFLEINVYCNYEGRRSSVVLKLENVDGLIEKLIEMRKEMV